jgi:hypothetical protein
MKSTSSIPSLEDWGRLDDLDVKYAFNLYGGRSLVEAMPFFVRSPIERADELLFTPWKVFICYIFCFADFLTSEQSKGESDCASCFLNLVLQRARADPQAFREFYPRLEPAIDKVAGRQRFYEASPQIYGFFSEYKRQIRAVLQAADNNERAPEGAH